MSDSSCALLVMDVREDCGADADPEVQRVLLETVFPRQAEVLDSESWGRTLT